jgi:hypothetical protein
MEISALTLRSLSNKLKGSVELQAEGPYCLHKDEEDKSCLMYYMRGNTGRQNWYGILGLSHDLKIKQWNI